MQTHTFKQRNNITELITRALPEILCGDDVEIIPFGLENIASTSNVLKRFLLTDDARCFYSGLQLKFAPDFIIFHNKQNAKKVYFVEIKSSITPLWYPKNKKQIEEIQGRSVSTCDISEIDRDALISYNMFYPEMIIIEGCNYNPKVISCQWIKKIKCLRCYKNGNEYYKCEECPLKTGITFKPTRNENSEGSQTPHANIDLSTFISFEAFFKSLSIEVNKEKLTELINVIKKIPLRKLDYLKPNVEKDVIDELRKSGCNWL